MKIKFCCDLLFEKFEKGDSIVTSDGVCLNLYNGGEQSINFCPFCGAEISILIDSRK